MGEKKTWFEEREERMMREPINLEVEFFMRDPLEETYRPKTRMAALSYYNGAFHAEIFLEIHTWKTFMRLIVIEVISSIMHEELHTCMHGQGIVEDDDEKCDDTIERLVYWLMMDNWKLPFYQLEVK